MTGIKKRLGSMLGPEGRTPRFVEGTTTQIAPNQPAQVDVVHVEDAEYRVDFHIPRGLDGDPAAIANLDETTAANINTQGTLTREAIHETFVYSHGFRNLVAAPDDEPLPEIQAGDLLVVYSTGEQFFEDFTTDLSGWTQRYVTGDWAIVEDPSARDGRALSKAHIYSSVRKGFTLDAVDDAIGITEVEVVAKLKSAALQSAPGPAVMVGGSGTASQVRGIQAGMQNNGLYVYQDGALVTYNDMTFTADEWYWIRLRLSADQVMVKAWRDDTAEPTDWDLTGTVQETSGWAGIYSNTSPAYFVDCIGIGTGGKPAPMEAI